jgi:hypothetical protein
MAQRTRAQLIAQITAQITTNGVGAITGAILNALLDDMADSDLNLTSDIARNRNVAVLAAGTPVAFPIALPSANYALTINCYDALATGNPVACAITNRTANGFTITPAINARLDYIAIIT